MNKQPFILIESPFTTKSGYGFRSYDFIKALIEVYPEWNIKLLPTAWGHTPQNALDVNNKEHQLLLSRIFREKTMTVQPDIHIQISVANECRPLGKYNILVTAGIETNFVSAAWLQGANKMNLTLVSSNHSRMSFLNAKYNQTDNRTKKVISQLKLETMIDTIFEGYDINKFYKTDTLEESIDETMNEIKEDFNFLFVGSWLNGEIGQDRKDVGMLVKTFLNTFKYNPTKEEAFIKRGLLNKVPALILKTQGATPSRMDKERIEKNINNIKNTVLNESEKNTILPNIYVIHGELSTSELNSLYNHPKVKTYISFTKGEGFNRTPLEFSTTEKPIMISNYGGHLDYLNHKGCTLLPGELKQVHPSVVWKDIIEVKSMWFTVNYDIASNKMADIFENYNKYVNKARQQKSKDWTYDKMKERIKMLFDKYIPKEIFSQELPLNL